MGFGGQNDDMGMMPPEQNLGGNAFAGNDMGGNPDMSGGGMPPMGRDPGMNDEPDMGGMPDMNGEGGEFGNDNSSEKKDGKKEIQRKTGELSQMLRDYNQEQGEPDVELNKYVSGMILKQSTDGLSEEDAEEIIKKVKSDEDFEEPDSEDSEMEDYEMNGPDGDMGQEPDMDGNDIPPMENQGQDNRNNNQMKFEGRGIFGRLLNEKVLDPTDNNSSDQQYLGHISNDECYSIKPFHSKRFK